MKYCAKCGTQNNDADKFCNSCGTQFEEQPQQQQAWQQPQQTWQQPQQAYQPQPVAPATPAIGVLKSSLASTLFMVAVILFSVTVLFSLISAFAGGDTGAFGDLLEAVDLDDLSDGISGVLIFSGIIGLIPSALICAGLWMLYTNAKDVTKNSVNPQGLTLIKVGAIINLVVTCLIMAIVEIILIIAMAALSDMASSAGMFYDVSGEAAAANAVLVIVMLLIAAITAFMIFYYVKIFKTINTVKNTALTGQPANTISQFVIVMCYIVGALGAIGALGSITSNFLGFISGGCEAAFMFIIGYSLSVYKKQMTAMMYPNGFVAQQQPQQTWQPPMQ